MKKRVFDPDGIFAARDRSLMQLIADMDAQLPPLGLPHKSAEPHEVDSTTNCSNGELTPRRRFIPAYSPEIRERGIQLFRESRADYTSDAATYRAVASKLGCSPDSVRSWCQQAERQARQRSGLASG